MIGTRRAARGAEMARLSLAAIARAVRGEVILGSRPPERGAEHEVDEIGRAHV